MHKFLIATVAALCAIASLFAATSAQAGAFNAHLKAPKATSALHKAGCKKRRFRRHAIQSVRRRAQKKAYYARQEAIARKRAIAQAEAAKRKAAQLKAAKLAKAKAAKAAAVETAAVDTAEIETEASSIATATGDVAAAPETSEQKVAVAKDLSCKQFFPAVGMTLTVPCE